MRTIAPKPLKLTVALASVCVLLSVLSSVQGQTNFDQAAKAYDQGKYDQAIHFYTQAIDRDNLDKDDLKSAYYWRAAAWHAKNQYDLAIVDYTRAAELKQKDEDIYISRGFAWAFKGAHDKALADFNRAIELKPKNSTAYIGRGTALWSKGSYDKSIAAFDRVIKLDPKDATGYNGRGMALRDKGAYDKGIADFNRAIKLDPTNARIYGNRGIAWHAKGACDKAIVDHNRAIALDPKTPIGYWLRGLAYFGCGKFADAARDFHSHPAPKPIDKYQAIWGYLARRRAGQPAGKDLDAFASKHVTDRSVWPGAVFEMLAGRIDAAKCLKAAEPKKPELTKADKTAPQAAYEKLRREQLCEAYFYIAQFELLAGRKDAARKLFKKCLATKVTRFFEHIVAKAELKRMEARAK
jgi:lipoprotein NlpI